MLLRTGNEFMAELAFAIPRFCRQGNERPDFGWVRRRWA